VIRYSSPIPSPLTPERIPEDPETFSTVGQMGYTLAPDEGQ
jgi:hypothetical protein